jgi:hypothetical protein
LRKEVFMQKCLVFFAVLLTFCTALGSYDIQQYSLGNGYRAIELADMNDDGFLEIIAGNGSSTNNIEIWSYDTLKDSLVLADSIMITGSSNWAHDIGVFDFEGDGDMDIVSAHRNSGLYISENEGGSWSTTNLNSTYAWQVLVADFDGDGNDDIFDGTDWDYIKVFYGDGSGNFTEGLAPPLEYTYGHARGFNAIDINDDSRLDLIGMASEWVFGGDNRSFLRAYLNIDTLPADTIEWTASVGPVDSFAYNPEWLESSCNSAADLDGNGYIDQVAYYNSGELVVFWGNISIDSLYWEEDTLESALPASPRAASIHDINEDGNPDIVVGGSTEFDGFKIYYGDGTGNFSPDSINLDHGVTSFNGHALEVGDINNDGYKDIVTSRGLDGFEVLFRKTGDVAATSILEPGSFVGPFTIFSPVAVYENLGADTATFEAWIVVDSAGSRVYSAYYPEKTLAPGLSDTLSTPPVDYVGDHGVVYDIYAFTVMQFDGNSSNDTISRKTSVFEVHDELISNWAVSPPTIDGVITPGEWDSSFVYDISDVAGNVDSFPNLPGECFLYLLNDDSTLYLGIDFISDTVLNDPIYGGAVADMIPLFIDENNDAAWDLDSTEGFYRMGWDGDTNITEYMSLPDSISENWVYPSDILFWRTLDNHQQYECSIPFGDDITLKHYLNNSGLPDTMGILIAAMNSLLVGDSTNVIGGEWPTGVDATIGTNPDPAVFGNVILSANPQGGVEEKEDVPSVYSLKLSSSISCTGNLKIQFDIPVQTETVEINLFDVNGRLRGKTVRRNLTPGYYNVEFTENITAGIYFVQMIADNFRDEKKTVVLK